MLTPHVRDELKEFSAPLQAVLMGLFVLHIITIFFGIFAFITSLFGLIFVAIGMYGVMRYSRSHLVAFSVLMFFEMVLTFSLFIFFITLLATTPGYTDEHWVIRPTKGIIITTTIVTGLRFLLEIVGVILAMKLAGEIKRQLFQQYLLYHPENPVISYHSTNIQDEQPTVTSQGMFVVPMEKRQENRTTKPGDFSIE